MAARDWLLDHGGRGSWLAIAAGLPVVFTGLTQDGRTIDVPPAGERVTFGPAGATGRSRSRDPRA